MATFGELIRQGRKEKGLKQEILAERLGISQGYLSHLENSERVQPRPGLVAAFSRHLEIPAADLLKALPESERRAWDPDYDPEVDAEVERQMANLANKLVPSDVPKVRAAIHHGLLAAKRERAHEPPKAGVRLIAEGTVSYDAEPSPRTKRAAGA